MELSIFDKLKKYFNKYITQITSNHLKSTITLVLIVLFYSFPSYDIAITTHEIDPRWNPIFLQGKEPFVNHNNLYGNGTHGEKLAFRFVPAIMLNILHMNTVIKALIFQFFTLIFFYYLLLLLFNDLFKERIKAYIYSLPICFIISGHVYVSDFGGIFDTLALDYLLLTLLLRKKLYVIIPLLLAYYTDERALIASPAIFLIIVFENNSYKSFTLIIKGILLRSNIYLFISWLLYFIIRFYLGRFCGLVTGTGLTNLFFEQINKTFYTMYVGLEGYIIIFIITLSYLLRKRIYTFTILLILSFLLVCYIAQSVTDINRSMSYILLIIILLLTLLDRVYTKEHMYKLIMFITFINIIYFEYYPFLAQIYRMKFITHSI